MTGTVLQIRSNGQITLPTSVRRQAGLKEGDLLEVVLDDDGSVHLIPKIAIDRSQAYFWTERWQAGEREAEEDLRTGRSRRFENVDDALAYLDEAE
ncbi:MAG: AbrB/MazE/SpoVT family DNA-binding domain-containing protein [Anaerolineaceae bacterium]|nr:AbrB/MazE/SpoVT family DNA-binding domain-containing protein [Anaerolineaceae bacterium]